MFLEDLVALTGTMALWISGNIFLFSEFPIQGISL